MPDPGGEPLGSSDDVLSRLRLRARLAAAEAGERPGGAHARPRLRLAPSRWAAIGLAAVALLAGAALLVPSWLAAMGNQSDQAAFGAASVASWAASSGAAGGATQTAQPDGAAGQSAGASPARLVVHVAGAVAAPGVYELEAGARVVDAIDAAGGPTAEADLAALNLAAWVGDGERVYVPRPGETPPPVSGSTGAGGGSGANGATGGQGGEGASSDGKINVNQADAQALTALPGIGPVLAGRIVAFREANGPFGGLDDLGEVSGIGSKILAGLAEAVAF
ncbi:MAG: helix-hairpin-helix domain-containing protein [Bifidobacteriaceae bacterium]|jgi:competence protein ComEA|nr:helix-hairpin-helix domain-containing protein [Bifidobacteriaceae bacterium]